VIRAALLVALVLVTGCAGYGEQLAKAQDRLHVGDTRAALDLVNKRLRVPTDADRPKKLGDDGALLLLERASLLQAEGSYRRAAHDMMAADQRMEWLDIRGASADEIFEASYSGTSGAYRSPPHERLLLNSLNIINFLALGDPESAKVEARRFALLESYFEDTGDDGDVLPGLRALGNYLGGVAFETGGDHDEAARYYARALAFGYADPELERRLVALVRLTGYKAGEVDRDGSVRAALASARSAGPLDLAGYQAEFGRSLLVVVQTGFAPSKKTERIPIGMAFVHAAHAPHIYTRRHHEHAVGLAAHGVLKWVNIPKLVRRGPDPGYASLRIDAGAVPIGHTAEVGAQIELAWSRVAGAIVAAALVRMVARALAGQAARVFMDQATADDRGRPAAGGALGWLAALATEGALTIADRPDTRSWTTLPERIHLYRLPVTSDSAELLVELGPHTDRRDISMRAQTTVVNFSRYR
jgi:tetratricopeptide (TPR) repeat protein